MSRELYHQEIRQLAEQAHGAGFLEAPSGRASLDSPMCGDRISVEVHVKDGVVLEYAHRVQGCLLCRAAASAIANRVTGAGLDELEGIRQAARAMLANEGAPPPGGWECLAAFAPAWAYRSRHECILLPFDALLAAVRSASGASLEAKR